MEDPHQFLSLVLGHPARINACCRMNRISLTVLSGIEVAYVGGSTAAVCWSNRS